MSEQVEKQPPKSMVEGMLAVFKRINSDEERIQELEAQLTEAIEIVQAVVKNGVLWPNYHTGMICCCYCTCSTEMPYDRDHLRHQPDCPVTKARALLASMEEPDKET